MYGCTCAGFTQRFSFNASGVTCHNRRVIPSAKDLLSSHFKLHVSLFKYQADVDRKQNDSKLKCLVYVYFATAQIKNGDSRGEFVHCRCDPVSKKNRK